MLSALQIVKWVLVYLARFLYIWLERGDVWRRRRMLSRSERGGRLGAVLVKEVDFLEENS